MGFRSIPFMKNHHHNGPIDPSSRTIIHEAIATRAYELWVAREKPEDQAEVIWLEAERELAAERAKD